MDKFYSNMVLTSPTSPMDYSIWGYLKQQLNKQKIEILDELKKRNFVLVAKDRSNLHR